LLQFGHLRLHALLVMAQERTPLCLVAGALPDQSGVTTDGVERHAS
jgi:hypothetical protein